MNFDKYIAQRASEEQPTQVWKMASNLIKIRVEQW